MVINSLVSNERRGQRDKLGAARVAVLGPDELDAGEVTLRDMATHTEAKVRLEEVVGEMGRAIL